MRDYWLDVLSDNQIERLETEWFANDQDAELLEVVRGDLIEDYLTNSLSRAELDKFKNHFLINNLEEVAIAESYLELNRTPEKQAAKAGFFETLAESWRSFISIPQIAFALLLVLGGFALFFSFYNSAPPAVDVAKNETPAESDRSGRNQNAINSAVPSQNETNPAAGEDNSGSSESSPNNNRKSVTDSAKSPSDVKNKTAGEKTPEKFVPRAAEPPAQPPVLFLTNFRGNVKTMKLAGENRNFSLKLDMPGLDKAYRSYEIRIYDSNNNLVVQQKLNDNLSLKKSGEKIEVRNLSKNKFRKNTTYKTYLVGYDEENNAEELSLYDSFKVN
ncbi:MAG: hypothetical protein M3384_22205 [Acidobacteriota bacterium]|nr:hypothetical protein [Acidobacteriota bacterium]